MSYTRVYTNRINWENYPSETTPINDSNLNAMDYAIYKHDEAILSLDTTKANQSNLLQSLKTVTYNQTTGVFTFTYWNGNTLVADLNIEKIPVSFSMSAEGVITMTTSDGTQYTADVGELIKTYSFEDSTDIDFTVTQDSSGNKIITATIPLGSVTAEKLQPNFLADVTEQAQLAYGSASNAAESETNAEIYAESARLAKSYAVGDEEARPGSSTDNAKYYKEQARVIVGGTDGHIIVDSEGNVMSNRMNLRFMNGFAQDDETGDTTKVTIGITETEWSAIQNVLT